MEATLKANRPNIGASTIKTYLSILSALARKLGATPSPTFFVDNSKKVLDHLKDIPYAKRKTVLAALVSLCGKNSCAEAYRGLMMKDIHDYNDLQKKQEMTTTQKDNWITQEQVKELYNKIAQDTKHLLKKKDLTSADKKAFMDFVILSVFVLIEPRRLLDYTAFKVRNIDTKVDNYMDKLSLVFNNYKTRKVYGQQKVKIPRALNFIIRRWAEKSGNDYLLFGDTGRPLNQSQLTLRLNKIFGKNVSVNALRHSFITENVLKNMPLLKKMEQTAENMGNSFQSQILYKKDTAPLDK
jgi:hypothetical protein